MLKLKLQYFGHLMRRADSLEKTLMLGKIEGKRRRRRWQRLRWLESITDSINMNLSKLWKIVKDVGACWAWAVAADQTRVSDRTTATTISDTGVGALTKTWSVTLTLALEGVQAGKVVKKNVGGWRKGDPCHLGIRDKLSPTVAGKVKQTWGMWLKKSVNRMLNVPTGFFQLHVMRYRKRDEPKQELFNLEVEFKDRRLRICLARKWYCPLCSVFVAGKKNRQSAMKAKDKIKSVSAGCPLRFL